jgi:hypothetical protein
MAEATLNHPFAEALGVSGFETPVQTGFSDDELLRLHKTWKKESFDNRWVWERNWMRNIHYTNNRMWITYVPINNVWRDVKLAKWVPKPVTPLIWEGVQALRAMFASVEVGANVRPNGADPETIAVAAYCDDLHPVLHKEHDMDEVMAEADYWFIVTGWTCLHTYLDSDVSYGTIQLAYEQCVACEAIYTEDKIAEANHMCPDCGGTEFMPSMDAATGETHKVIAKKRGKTIALSPFEVAFPNTYARFSDVPYVYVLRWRSKEYYTSHPKLAAQVAKFNWTKAPSEASLQLFRSLPFHTDSGSLSPFLNGKAGDEEGAVEYECWVRPCEKYPKGLVFRALGDNNPIILHLEEEEGLPGVLPYVDVDGNPLFTFDAAPFEQRGGRVYGSSPLDAGIPIMNQINQIDSMNQMYLNRMANPVWMIPKGAGIQKFTGEPGLVVEWNPLTVGGNAKPERMDGASIPASVFQLRDQKVSDLEEALGTYDVLKGERPPNVNAFSAMQLLVERAQSRFASSFKSRGRMYGSWLKFALEIERAFGEETRRAMTLSPAGTWVEQVFKNTDLQGSFNVIVEDGSMQPKSALGQRAMVEHLVGLGAMNPADPDTNWQILRTFGGTRFTPSLDVQMQAALRKQQAFEAWALDPQAQMASQQQGQQALMEYESKLVEARPPVEQPPVTGPDGQQTPQPQQDPAAMLPPPPTPNQFTPLKWLKWYKPEIHMQEFMKWANSDKMVELMKTNPAIEKLLEAHYMEIEGALMMQQAMAVQATAAVRPGAEGLPNAQGGKGSAKSMENSNTQSGKSDGAS